MASAIEESFCYAIAIIVVDASQTHPDGILSLSILSQGDGQAHVLDTQWFVDQSLGISLYEVKTLHLFFGESIITCMASWQHLQFLVHDIPSHPDA